MKSACTESDARQRRGAMGNARPRTAATMRWRRSLVALALAPSPTARAGAAGFVGERQLRQPDLPRRRPAASLDARGAEKPDVAAVEVGAHAVAEPQHRPPLARLRDAHRTTDVEARSPATWASTRRRATSASSATRRRRQHGAGSQLRGERRGHAASTATVRPRRGSRCTSSKDWKQKRAQYAAQRLLRQQRLPPARREVRLLPRQDRSRDRRRRPSAAAVRDGRLRPGDEALGRLRTSSRRRRSTSTRRSGRIGQVVGLREARRDDRRPRRRQQLPGARQVRPLQGPATATSATTSWSRTRCARRRATTRWSTSCSRTVLAASRATLDGRWSSLKRRGREQRRRGRSRRPTTCAAGSSGIEDQLMQRGINQAETSACSAGRVTAAGQRQPAPHFAHSRPPKSNVLKPAGRRAPLVVHHRPAASRSRLGLQALCPPPLRRREVRSHQRRHAHPGGGRRPHRLRPGRVRRRSRVRSREAVQTLKSPRGRRGARGRR